MLPIYQLPSKNRMSFSGGGGAPIIQPIVTGSLAPASKGEGVGNCAANGAAATARAKVAGDEIRGKRIMLLAN